MNKLFLFCLLFSVASCANSQENKTTQSAESEMTTLPKQPAKTVKKAPELTAEQKKKLPRNYIVENSRQAKDIDDVYPYDIDF
ncbi:MAG: hypothetical protein ACI9JY_002861, partial [Saprospiraceae bacterium]